MEKREPIYRIKVEVIDEGDSEHEIHESLKKGIECRGFAMLLDDGEAGTSTMNNMTLLDLAKIMVSEGHFLAASLIAQAMRESMKYTEPLT